jgi:hypothetical protein
MRIVKDATYAQLTGGTVGVSEILVEIDREIAQLQLARNLLAGAVAAAPKKAAAAAKEQKPGKKRKKRKLSAEGRKRIAEAQRLRWAAKKKAAAGK